MDASAAAPLEAHDPERARALKAKIRDRVTDLRRHLVALRTAMADFGEDFDLEAFRQAHGSADPVVLNRVKAVERGLDRLRELRRLLVHDYAIATAEQVHEAARIVADEFLPFYEAYRAWISRGFSARGSAK